MTTSVPVRRCRLLYIEPRQVAAFQLQQVLAGGTGLKTQTVWTALAPHLDAPVPLSEAQLLLLGRLDAQQWAASPCAAEDADLQYLLACGLVTAMDQQSAPLAEREEKLRALPWWGPAALAHWDGRWQGQDSVKELEAVGLQTADGLRAQLGAPPPALLGAGTEVTPLPRQPGHAFDQQLRERSTCRNFDTDRALPLEALSLLLQRTLAETGRQVVGPDAVFLKKNVPSAGGLHPTEAYVLVRQVEGLAPGLYHYDPAGHGLSALPATGRSVTALATLFTAGQHWFAQAHALVVLAPRFARTYWKYRQHAKAYRATILDVGHISQLLLTCATEQGLGAFVTAAINERDIEDAIGLDPMQQSPLAVCGVGWRAQQLRTSEFDPGRHVWQPAGAPVPAPA